MERVLPRLRQDPERNLKAWAEFVFFRLTQILDADLSLKLILI